MGGRYNKPQCWGVHNNVIQETLSTVLIIIGLLIIFGILLYCTYMTHPALFTLFVIIIGLVAIGIGVLLKE